MIKLTGKKMFTILPLKCCLYRSIYFPNSPKRRGHGLYAAELSSTLRYLSTLWPILQLIAHHIQDKLAVSFDSSSIGLISYKWFLTIDAKYSSVKACNEENSFF